MTQSEIIHVADQHLRRAGLLPVPIVADGQKHRCPVEGKPKSQDGEYRIYADERPRFVWKNYRTGQYGTDKLYSKNVVYERDSFLSWLEPRLSDQEGRSL